MKLELILSRHPWAGRWLALGLLLTLLAGAAYMVSLEIRSQHEHYDHLIETRTGLIAGYLRVAANRTQFEEAVRRIGKLDTARYYLKSSSPSLAAAEIQDIAQTILLANGMKPNSVNIAPHKDENGRRKVSVTLNLRGTPEAMQRVLYALESNVPYLFVDNLAIRSTVNNRRWQPTPMVEPEVQVQFDLIGYAQIGKKR